MAIEKATRLSKVAREFNVGISTIVEFLNKKGYQVDENPNAKLSPVCYAILLSEYSKDIAVKKEKEELTLRTLKGKKEAISIDEEDFVEEELNDEKDNDKIIIITDNNLDEEKKSKKEKTKDDVDIKLKKTESNIKIVGKIDLEKKEKKEEKKPEIIKVEEEKSEKKIEIIETEEIIKIEEKTSKTKEEISKTEDIDEKQEVLKEDNDLKVIGRIDLDSINQKTRPKRKTKEEKLEEKKIREKSKKHFPKRHEKTESKESIDQDEIEIITPRKVTVDLDFIETEIKKLSGPTVIGRIDLPQKSEKKKIIPQNKEKANITKKRKRKRINKPVTVDNNRPPVKQVLPKDKVKDKNKSIRRPIKKEVDDKEVQKQIKDTLARLTSKGKSKGVKHRREKRDDVRTKQQAIFDEQEKEKKILKVTEFVTANELAGMIDVPVTKIIAACMSLGMFVSINQRLNAETISLVSDEFGFDVEFVSVELQEAIEEEADAEEDLIARPPIITVMGHVDHGKTSLLDYIRSTNIIAGEAGGITQHIGAYNVTLKDGRSVTFLDTPGHEAFTAMRARGAQVTDIVIIVIAADDKIMPQTIEAINHAQAASVPIIFAINKIDKPNANPERVKEELAGMNFLVEEWGGKYQSKDISAKTGKNIDTLMEEVFLAAEMLELKANPNKKAIGAVIESSLDKGRGYVSTVLISNGTLKVGDVILAGSSFGKVKAIYNERNVRIEKVGPAEPAVILGLNGAPKAGDNFNVMDTDREAREIAVKREQLQREQDLRTNRHITLDEIGRRLAIGNFQELNIIVKGDVDGSVEALSDSLLKLSSDEIQVNIIHKAVGQIAETDVMLANASDAIIIGFQVRPSLSARKLAEKDQIEIRLYSIIYDAINEIKDAILGMLAPEIKEEITALVEVRETYKITKVGTIAGCMVKEGKISRNSNIRVIRDGIVVYTGTLGSLKRFKDDAKDVAKGFECGLNIDKYNDIKVGDIVEAYEQVEIKRKI
ncbi:MAG: translation initiation factor IF-2 [Bacteroidales bacterium]|nr:translation initiation factor IF-2 [Bacteroidales bacterium]MBN2757760.1 translation initiation factor IF-2 [Bacteroidales bacterium]